MQLDMFCLKLTFGKLNCPVQKLCQGVNRVIIVQISII